MDDLVKFLRLRDSLTTHIDSCRIFRSSPGWIRDRVLAVDYRTDPDAPWEFSEILLAEAFHDGGRRDYFFLSLLEDSDSSSPMEADFGAGKFLRDGQPGNMIFGDEQSVQRCQGRGPYHSSMIYVSKDVVHRYFQEATQGSHVAPEKLLSRSFRDETLRVLMKRLIYLCRQPQQTGHRMLKEQLQDSILQRLVGLAGYQTGSFTDRDRLSHIGMRNVVEYMQSHFVEDLSLDQLAAKANVSRGHFVRLFRQSLGMSPKQFIMQRRLDLARQLLLTSDRAYSILQIAQQCGFCDQSHLAREFRQVYGVTPAAFRREQT